MNKLLIKVSEMLGLFNKTRKWLKGKKTIISSVGGVLASASTLVILTLSWIDGEVDATTFLEQAKIPAGAFWVSITFLFSATHPKNVLEAKK